MQLDRTWSEEPLGVGPQQILCDAIGRVYLGSGFKPGASEPFNICWFWTPDPFADTVTFAVATQGAGDQIDIQTMSRDLTIPANKVWRRFRGFRVRMYGWGVGFPYDEDPPWPAAHMTAFRNGSWEEIVIQVWHARVWRDDSPVFAEMTWNPTTGHLWQTGGYHNPPTPQEWSIAKKAMALLDEVARRGPGRRRGSKGKEAYPTRESYVAAIRQLHARAKRSGWKPEDADEARLARWLRISKNTMRARNEEYGIATDDIRHWRE